MSDLKLSDHTDLAKVLCRADPGGSLAAALAVPYGQAVRDSDGTLVAGIAPGAWVLLSSAGSAGTVTQRIEQRTDDGEFVSVVDVTHGHSALRLSGSAAAGVLATVCAIDLSDEVTPGGTALRTQLAGITVTAIRDDADGERSYLMLCDRSHGRYLFDVLTDVGRESYPTACAVDGGERPGSY